MNIAETERASAANATAVRVSLTDIVAAIDGTYYTTGYDAVDLIEDTHVQPLKVLTICIVVMKNGFTVIGKSAPASPENFNKELGEKFAYDDAIRQIWPLMGFALRERLYGAEQ